MNEIKRYSSVLLIFLCIFICKPTVGQSVQQNLSGLNVDGMSDAQIKQYVDQAHASGLSDAQLLQAAQAKGMSADQIQRLQTRINNLNANSNAEVSEQPATRSAAANFTSPESTVPKVESNSRIFGADLFRNSTGNSFEPNLKIATPKNYIVGPDDQLHISVNGNSVADWKLNVSPEGNINIPGVGILNVAGKTIETVTAAIKNKLAANNYAIGRGTTADVDLGGTIRSIHVILQGQLVKPGTYTLPSLSSVFNALYSAAGPNDIGSFRKIEIIRNNKIIRHLDLYDFLVKGSQKDNIMLEDQDVIRVPAYDTHVDLSGEVKIPAIFETIQGETLADVIRFAGGFTDQSYRNRIKVSQVSGQQRRISDIVEADYNKYIPHAGDKYMVDRILDRFENRVSINGAVFRPGEYELQSGLTLSQLIKNAAGLTEDAFTPRGNITRLKPDNTLESVSFNVADIVSGKIADIPLQREDVVSISSIFDLRDAYNVTINGEVRNGGTFAYANNMTIEDVIIKAGGFTEGASTKRIEVARRVTNSDPLSKTSLVSQVFSASVDQNLNTSDLSFKLEPFDIISVYGLPGYEKQRTIMVTGEVLYPGPYTITNKNEKISAVIARAGGLTAFADATGGTLKRSNTALLGADEKNKVDVNELVQDRTSKLKLLKKNSKDSTSVDEDLQLRNNYVGINLKEILTKPGSKTDLILEDGDEIRVPKQQQVVKLNGEILYPSAVVYSSGKGLKGYISNAGGFSSLALKRSVYVVYPNGTVESTHKFLFFNVYPSIKPGSEIYVPKKIIKPGLSPQELLGITTGIASLGAIVLGIINLTK